ncbi:hypothetical protein LIER_08172 [Lithospermum erythrorhizon]|uniref:Uncharacterized protein n=1 Tax=Lithospermum erythrorhizon TaxID=34254 RepID=A0AAV3PCA2_LITER
MFGGSNQEILYTSAQQEIVPPRPDSLVMNVAQEVASRYKDEDLGGNPLNSGVISSKPLSVRPPSSSATESSQARSTPSVPQPVETAQGGTTTNKLGDIHTVIHDSLLVDFSKEDLDNFRRYFSIPSFVEMRFPLEGEQVFEPLVDPSHNEGPLAPGWSAMYIVSLSY